MNSSICRLWKYIEADHKKQIRLLLSLMVIVSIAEVLSVGAVMPFLAILMAPEKIFAINDLAPMLNFLGIHEPDQLLLPISLFFIGTTIFAAVLRFIILRKQIKIGHSIGADLSLQIFKKTLYQPYLGHISRNSSHVISGIVTKVDTVVHGVIVPLFTTLSSVLTFSAILGVLLLIDTQITIISLCSFGCLYIVIMVITKKKLFQNSERINQESSQLVKVLQEGLGGIRDIILDGSQMIYCKIFYSTDFPRRVALANNQIIGSAPRILVETLVIALIAMLAYTVSGRDGSLAFTIPTLGTLALAAQRLIPIIHQLYISWSNFIGAQASLRDVLAFIEQALPDNIHNLSIHPISFKNSITLTNISFKYPNKTTWVLDDISLEIPKGCRIGFMGVTGSGKSTLIDLLMGLLESQKGVLAVDGETINKVNIRSWQAHISHVPQAIFLADATIAENIAFGIPLQKIDYELLNKVVDQAQLTDFIKSLDKGLMTNIGERGARLSGGQRQRIGIARALYKNTDVIIFDEATSALDSETEFAVMNVVNEISKDLTLLMVAHRLSTLKCCDVIYEINQGEIVRFGSYAEMVEKV